MTAPTEPQQALEAELVAAAVLTLAPAIVAAVAAWWALWRTLELAGRAALSLTFVRSTLGAGLTRILADVPADLTERLEVALGEHGRGDTALARLVADADQVIRRELAGALELTQALDFAGEDDATTVAAKVAGITRRASDVAALVANTAANADVAREARALGRRLLWMAEADACPHCLAYAGEHIAPGASFPLQLTFYVDPDGALKPIPRETPLPYPPLHPRCRCAVRSYDPGLSPGLAETLKREAQRTIALGRSAFMSEPAKRRAADVLLSGATLLPRSVGRRRAA